LLFAIVKFELRYMRINDGTKNELQQVSVPGKE